MAGNLNGRAEWFIVLVFVAGAAAFTGSFFLEPLHSPVGLAVTIGLTCVAEALAVRLHQGGKVSISTAGIVVAGLVWGLPGAALAAATVTLTGWFFAQRAGPVKLAFNFGQQSLASLAGPAVLFSLEHHQLLSNPIAAVGAGVTIALCIFVVSSCAVTGIISLTTGNSLRATYRANIPWLFPHYVALGAVGGGLGFAYDVLGEAGLIILAVPLLLPRYSMKQVLDQTRENVLRLEKSNQQLQGAYLEIRSMSEELSRAYTGTLESLVAALDVRDQETRGHSVRVATHAIDIAEMLGIKDEHELGSIYRGALMHDVGKIGVPDAILRKPTKLTEEEWEFMRRHPAMGYKILAQVPYLRPTARIVLAHHERWDGDGYPRGLKGEDIPLGARIFAICDTYDAIISDRPYRKGQEPDAAFAEILRCAGTQFDPKVVEAFEAVFPRWREEEIGKNVRPLYLPAWRRHDDEAGRAAS